MQLTRAVIIAAIAASTTSALPRCRTGEHICSDMEEHMNQDQLPSAPDLKDEQVRRVSADPHMEAGSLATDTGRQPRIRQRSMDNGPGGMGNGASRRLGLDRMEPDQAMADLHLSPPRSDMKMNRPDDEERQLVQSGRDDQRSRVMVNEGMGMGMGMGMPSESGMRVPLRVRELVKSFRQDGMMRMQQQNQAQSLEARQDKGRGQMSANKLDGGGKRQPESPMMHGEHIQEQPRDRMSHVANTNNRDDEGPAGRRLHDAVRKMQMPEDPSRRMQDASSSPLSKRDSATERLANQDQRMPDERSRMDQDRHNMQQQQQMQPDMELVSCLKAAMGDLHQKSLCLASSYDRGQNSM